MCGHIYVHKITYYMYLWVVINMHVHVFYFPKLWKLYRFYFPKP